MKKIGRFFLILAVLFSCSSFAYADISNWINYPDFILKQHDDEGFTSEYMRVQDASSQIKILPDGSAWITEKRVMHLRGHFDKFELSVPYFQKGMKVDSSQVRELDKSTPDKCHVYYDIEGNGAQNGCSIIWYFFSKKDRYRTFIISYHVTNAVIVCKDIAYFDWQFQDLYSAGMCSEDVRNLTVSIDLPSGAKKNEVMAWGHGPLYGKFNTISPNRVLCDVNNLYLYNLIEGRVAFPPRLIKKGGIRYQCIGLPTILKKEYTNVKKSKRNIASDTEKLGLLILGLLILIYWIVLAVSETKYYRLPKNVPPSNKLPEKGTPAISQYLYSIVGKSNGVFAMILDLIRRGILNVELFREDRDTSVSESFKNKIEKVRIHLMEDNMDSLFPHEKSILEFLFKNDNLREIFPSKLKHMRRFERRKRWRRKIKDDAKNLNLLVDSRKINITKILAIIIPIFCITVSFVYSTKSDFIAFVYMYDYALFLGFIPRIFLYPRFSPEGFEVRNQLSALRKYFLDFSKGETYGLPSLKEWNQYLPYAVALKTEKSVIRQLIDTYPEIRQAIFAQFLTSDLENQETPSDLTILITMLTLIDPKYMENEINRLKGTIY